MEKARSRNKGGITDLRAVAARGPRFAARSLLFPALLALASCKSQPIVVTPAEQLFGQIVDASGAPIASTEVDLFTFDRVHVQDTNLGEDAQYATSQTAADGTFELDLPRHATVNASIEPRTKYIVKVPSAYGFPLYGFATQNQIVVDLVSTALYELITTTPLPAAQPSSYPQPFTTQQINSLLAQARASIASSIASNMIIPSTTTPDHLYRAIKNALQADPSFIANYQLYALADGINVIGLIAYGALDSQPRILGWTPHHNTANVNEMQTLSLNVQAVDYDKDDFIFYSWTIQPAGGQSCSQLTGTPRTVQLANLAWDFTPDYSYADWLNTNKQYYVAATASDGGRKDVYGWCVTVANVERAPVFSTAAPKTATEDALWTYTPAASSPGGAPFRLSLNTGAFPAGMDMCIDTSPLVWPAVPSVWQWQVAGTPCTQPNFITWTPTNCQSIGMNFVQIKALDYANAVSFQTFNVTVTEVNTAPTITSNPPGAPAPTGAELIPWSYQVTVNDPQADPAAFPGSVSGSDPSPYAYKPGGVGCPDQINFTLTQAPPSAKIDSNTGLITWSPQDNETGVQNFTVFVTDGHGGSTSQSWRVAVQPLEEPPSFVGPSGGTTIQINEEKYTQTPFGFSVNVHDPNIIENNDVGLSVNLTGLPPAMTFIGHGNNGTGAHFDYSWALTDNNTPSTWSVSATVCDTNPTDQPLAAYLAPIYPVMGPPHNHFCNVESFTLSAPKRNIQPQFTSNPTTQVLGTTAYSYVAAAYDGNINPADTLTFTLQQAPTGMTITPGSTTAPTGTATLSWTPNNTTDLGYHNIQVQVADSNSYPGDPHTNVQYFSLFVQEMNCPVTITSSPVTTAQDGSLYNYQLTYSDSCLTVPNKTITWSLTTYPSGMTINSKTGLISWTPTVAQALAGTANVTVKATSGGTSPAYSATQSYTISLTYVNLPPVFNPTTNPIIPIKQTFTYTFSATDPDGDPISFSATGLPTGATFVDNGDGTATFTWTPVAPATPTINVTAQDTYGGGLHHIVTLVWSVNAVNSPIFLSNPVLSANTNGNYLYEVHCLDPAGGGLTFSLDTAPGGMSVSTNKTTKITTVTWSPSSSNSGNNSVILRATDVNGNSTTQNYIVNVTTSTNYPPTVNSTTPDNSVTVVATEGHSLPISISATDADGDSVHYAWYWDGTWVYDASSTYSLVPSNTSAGDHALHADVTDGASVVGVDFTVHVRDAQPVIDRTYGFASGTFQQMAVLPRAGEIVTLRGGASPTIDFFTEAGFQSGPTGTASSLPFAPARFSVENDFGSPTYLYVYFSQSSAINASNTYASFATDTYSPAGCSASLCFPAVFTSAYAMAGGTNTAYLMSSGTSFNINPANREYLSSYHGSSPNADVDLGAGASASSVVLDTVDSPPKLFVSIPNQDKIVVLNATTRVVTGSISLPAGAGPTALYFNAATSKLYSYNTAAGTLSEISTPTNTLNSTTGGLPTAPSILNDPPPIIAGNDADSIIYIANSDHSEIVIFDVNYGTSKALTSQSANVVFFDSTSKIPIFGYFSGREIFNTK